MGSALLCGCFGFVPKSKNTPSKASAAPSATQGLPVSQVNGHADRPIQRPSITEPSTPQLQMELCVKLPQAMGGATWLMRLEAGLVLFASLVHADGASISLLLADDDAEGRDGSMRASVLTACGAWGPTLFHQAHSCPQAGATTCSWQMLMHGEAEGGALLLPTTSSRLPDDWAHITNVASELTHFCALPLHVGDHLIGFITLAWAADCPVPPGLRPVHNHHTDQPLNTTRGSGPGGLQGREGGSQRLGQEAAAGAGRAPATAAERACLVQMAQVFALGMFGDPTNVVFGGHVAALLARVSTAHTLQAAFDAMMAGVREAISQRCQLDMGAVLAVAHPALPTAAYVQESHGRTLPVPVPVPGLAPGPGGGGTRGGGHSSCQTQSGPAGAHVANALGTSQPRGGSGAQSRVPTVNAHHPSTGGGKALAGGGNGGGGGAAAATTWGSGAAGVGGCTSNSTSVRPGRGTVGRDGERAGPAFRTNSALLSGDFGLMTEDEDCGVQHSVQAHVASLAHTLLLACLGAAAQGDAAAHADTCLPYGTGAAVAGGAANRSLQERRKVQHAVSPLAALTPLAAVGSGQGTGMAAAAVGAGAYGVTADGCVVPNCNAHMQDEMAPCRDLALCQALTRVQVHALALVVARPAEARWLPHGAVGVREATVPSLALYLVSPDHVARQALALAQLEAHSVLRLALTVLWRLVTRGCMVDEWSGLLEALTPSSATGRVSYGSSRLVQLLRPRSGLLSHAHPHVCTQASVDFLPSMASIPSRSHLESYGGGTCLSTDIMRSSTATAVRLVDSGVEQPLMQLDAMVSSIQSTLSTMQLFETQELAEFRISDISAVELMEIVGRGGQGVVFRGTVHGIEAAVKVISHKDNDDKPDAAAKAKANGEGGAGGAAGEPPAAAAARDSMRYDEARMRERKRALLRDAHELAVTSSISHPSIVQMYGYFTDCVVVQYTNQSSRLRLLPADSEALAQHGSQRGPTNTVMCMEYCDAGTLKSEAEAGAFRQPGVSAKSGPACPALVPLYTSLLELALALRHLHSRRLVHCDLKPSNVLLKSSLRDPRGWTCKLSDFGCVRLMVEDGPGARLGFRQPQPLGTLTHMAPEMFTRNNLLDGSIDIYAFGITMWELLMVAPLYDGAGAKEKLPSMVRRGLRPVFHPLAAPEYRMLATACWMDDPRRRPTAAVLVTTLQRLLARAQSAPAPTPPPLYNLISGSGGGGGSVHIRPQSKPGRQPPRASASCSSVAAPSGAAAAAEAAAAAGSSLLPNGGGGGGGGSAADDGRRSGVGAVSRRCTVPSGLEAPPPPLAAGSPGLQLQMPSPSSAVQPPPVSSPLSREAGPTARAAMRVGGDGGMVTSFRSRNASVPSPPPPPQPAAAPPPQELEPEVQPPPHAQQDGTAVRRSNSGAVPFARRGSGGETPVNATRSLSTSRLSLGQAVSISEAAARVASSSSADNATGRGLLCERIQQKQQQQQQQQGPEAAEGPEAPGTGRGSDWSTVGSHGPLPGPGAAAAAAAEAAAAVAAAPDPFSFTASEAASPFTASSQLHSSSQSRSRSRSTSQPNGKVPA